MGTLCLGVLIPRAHYLALTEQPLPVMNGGFESFFKNTEVCANFDFDKEIDDRRRYSYVSGQYGEFLELHLKKTPSSVCLVKNAADRVNISAPLKDTQDNISMFNGFTHITRYLLGLPPELSQYLIQYPMERRPVESAFTSTSLSHSDMHSSWFTAGLGYLAPADKDAVEYLAIAMIPTDRCFTLDHTRELLPIKWAMDRNPDKALDCDGIGIPYICPSEVIEWFVCKPAHKIRHYGDDPNKERAYISISNPTKIIWGSRRGIASQPSERQAQEASSRSYLRTRHSSQTSTEHTSRFG